MPESEQQAPYGGENMRPATDKPEEDRAQLAVLIDRVQSGDAEVIFINPKGDTVIVDLCAKSNEWLERVKAREVDSPETANLAAVDLVSLAKLNRALEGAKKSYLTPINDRLKALRADFDVILKPALEAEAILKKKMVDYIKTQDEKKCQIDEANALNARAAELRAKATGEVQPPVEIIPTVAAPEKTITTNTGAVSTAKVWKFEVTDFKLVPDEFKTIDTVALGKQVRAGRHEIPGVRVWPEDVIKASPR